MVGVNKYRLNEEQRVDVLSIDNESVRNSQIKRLNKCRATRDQALVHSALQKLQESASLTEGTGSGKHPMNLLKLAIEAARVRATLGEISTALETVWGRHVASTNGVISSPFFFSTLYEPFVMIQFTHLLITMNRYIFVCI